MHSLPRLLSGVLLCGLVLAPAIAETAEDTAAPRGASNVLVTFRVIGEDGSRADLNRSYELVAMEGRRTSLMIGDRIPIPVTTFPSGDSGDTIIPMTSFTYQNVGFTADVEISIHTDQTLTLRAEIEDSIYTGQNTLSGQPIIRTGQQKLEVTLKENEPLKIARVQNAGSRSGYFEVEARILD